MHVVVGQEARRLGVQEADQEVRRLGGQETGQEEVVGLAKDTKEHNMNFPIWRNGNFKLLV